MCAASPSLGPAGEMSQMSPAVSSLHGDKENLDNVLVLTSPYRPSKNPSPHPKKVFDPPPLISTPVVSFDMCSSCIFAHMLRSRWIGSTVQSYELHGGASADQEGADRGGRRFR